MPGRTKGRPSDRHRQRHRGRVAVRAKGRAQVVRVALAAWLASMADTPSPAHTVLAEQALRILCCAGRARLSVAILPCATSSPGWPPSAIRHLSGQPCWQCHIILRRQPRPGVCHGQRPAAHLCRPGGGRRRGPGELTGYAAALAGGPSLKTRKPFSGWKRGWSGREHHRLLSCRRSQPVLRHGRHRCRPRCTIPLAFPAGLLAGQDPQDHPRRLGRRSVLRPDQAASRLTRVGRSARIRNRPTGLAISGPSAATFTGFSSSVPESAW